jgi:hypothetical protein
MTLGHGDWSYIGLGLALLWDGALMGITDGMEVYDLLICVWSDAQLSTISFYMILTPFSSPLLSFTPKTHHERYAELRVCLIAIMGSGNRHGVLH